MNTLLTLILKCENNRYTPKTLSIVNAEKKQMNFDILKEHISVSLKDS